MAGQKKILGIIKLFFLDFFSFIHAQIYWSAVGGRVYLEICLMFFLKSTVFRKNIPLQF